MQEKKAWALLEKPDPSISRVGARFSSKGAVKDQGRLGGGEGEGMSSPSVQPGQQSFKNHWPDELTPLGYTNAAIDLVPELPLA